MANIISFDTEEWFYAHFFETYISFDDWDKQTPRVKIGLTKILNTLRKHKVKATFFIVGKTAEKCPEIIPLIEEDGHEIGSHGYAHQYITNQTPKEFAQDIRKAKKCIEKYSSKEVIGYRAPAYTITPKTSWALDILKDEGYEYDSSLYPISVHPSYGFPQAPTVPFILENNLVEFPLSTVNIFGKEMPFGSGAYFRIFPYLFTDFALSKLNKADKFATFNMHPWEFDTEQEKISIGKLNSFRHYYNRRKNVTKLNKLLSNYEFTTFRKVIDKTNLPQMELKNGNFKKI